MPTIDEMPDSDTPQHALIVGETKMGKSSWAVEAARDGYELLYLDRDNGLATIKEDLANDLAAKKRIHYLAPESMIDFMELFLTMPVMVWNERTNLLLNVNALLPTDKLVRIYPGRMKMNMILVIDTWTSLAYSALMAKADKMQVNLEDIDKWGREIYGNAGFRCTNIAKVLQKAPFHQIVMAHSYRHEIKEKPAGITGDIKEKDMIIVDTVLVPQSTSGPHGYGMGQYFSQIGWITLNGASIRQLDFSVKKGRIGGGTVRNAKGGQIFDPRTDGRWSSLFGKPKVYENQLPWIQHITGEEYKAEIAARNAAAPTLGSKLRPALAAPTVPAGPLGLNQQKETK